jgi:hypothetical protein
MVNIPGASIHYRRRAGRSPESSEAPKLQAQQTLDERLKMRLKGAFLRSRIAVV